MAAKSAAPTDSADLQKAEPQGKQRRHHVRWAVVSEMGLAWLITLPAAAVLAALALPLWRSIA